MKRLACLVLFLACCSGVALAQWAAVLGASVGSTVNATDATRGYEVNSNPSGWTTNSDAEGKLNIFDTAQAYQLTHSISVTLGATTTKAYQTYDSGANRTASSSCLWFYANTSTGGDDALYIWEIGGTAAGSSPNLRIAYQKSSGSYYFRIRGTTFPAGVTALTTPAWYRLEVQYVKNATSTLKIFNTSGTQIGSDVTCTASANAVDRYFHAGVCETVATTGWSPVYLDAVGLAWSGTPAYPLWPYTVNN